MFSLTFIAQVDFKISVPFNPFNFLPHLCRASNELARFPSLTSPLQKPVGFPSYGTMTSTFGRALVWKKLRIFVDFSVSVMRSNQCLRLVYSSPTRMRYSSTSRDAIHVVSEPYRARQEASAAYCELLTPFCLMRVNLTISIHVL
ncbi:hypothetical protein ACHAXS_010488 [Conticribra weissflogii]